MRFRCRWVCLRCRRDKFQHPGPHRCGNQYRKKGWWVARSKCFKNLEAGTISNK